MSKEERKVIAALHKLTRGVESVIVYRVSCTDTDTKKLLDIRTYASSNLLNMVERYERDLFDEGIIHHEQNLEMATLAAKEGVYNEQPTNYYQ